MSILLVVLLIAIVVFPAMLLASERNSTHTVSETKANKESGTQHLYTYNDEKTDYIKEQGITSLAKESIYTDSYYSSGINRNKGTSISFFVDQVSMKIAVVSNHGLREVAPFRNILGCDIITDSKVTGGIGRAVVGGVLAGETGALVGAMTAPEKIVSYKVVIYLNNAYDPMIEIPIIEEKKSTKSADYTNAVKFAESISATIKAIVYQNSKTARQALQ